VGRYGLGEVASWRFEVWNEMWGIPYGPDDGEYLPLYNASAFALKEQFCFQLKALRLVPVFLGISAFALWLEVVVLSAPLLGLTGLIYARLALAKATMPLHFDIGDKSKYQV
jgi:hypothetical protein